MTKPYAVGLRETLLVEAAGLRRALRERESMAIESAPEECERMMLAGAREIYLSKVDRESRRLRDVEAALDRMDRGKFGLCADCEDPIPAKRLAAIPWASRCVRCQESADVELIGVDSAVADYAV